MTNPTVTIAIPVLNEELRIEDSLDAVHDQTYANIVEVLVVDGGSDDATRGIAARFPLVRIIDNPRRRQAAGLNLALGAAQGEVIVRVDARSVVAPTYVAACVRALESGAAMVGGRQVSVGTGCPQRGIAAALNSRVGGGTAAFRQSTTPQSVDTVYLGAFRRETAIAAGGYDESKPTNEDAEFARRMSAHGSIWLDPAITSEYRPRETLPALARQYFSYGRGRAATLRTDAASLAGRQMAAPLLLLGLSSPWRRHVALGYAALVGAGVLGRPADQRSCTAAFVAAIPTMHIAWGAGFFRGLLAVGAG